MKKLITIYVVVGLILISTCVSWATPTVNPPPDAPGWWNAECKFYAYGWWEADISPGTSDVHPPNDADHWASNFLTNAKFSAGAAGQTQVWLNLMNVYRPDFKKEIYIYIEGTKANNNQAPTLLLFDTDSGTFTGSKGGSDLGTEWRYVVSGEIIPQPERVQLYINVPGLTKVTNIWAGENCIPEPATIALLGLGALSLLKRRRA